MSVIRCCETVSPLRPLIRAASSIWVRPSSSRRRAISSPKDFTLLSPHVLSLNRQTSHGSFFFPPCSPPHPRVGVPSLKPKQIAAHISRRAGQKRPGTSRNLTPLFLRKRRAARKGRKKRPAPLAPGRERQENTPMIVRGDARKIPLRDQTVQCIV